MKFRRLLTWALAATFLLPAPGAFAGSDSNDGDLGSGGNPGGSTGSDYRYWCSGERRLRQRLPNGPVEVWDSVSPSCVVQGLPWKDRVDYVGDGPGNYAGFSLCPNGLEVWRFWGDETNTMRGWSVSRINVDRATRATCSQNQPGNRFTYDALYPHPDDAFSAAVSAQAGPVVRPVTTSSFSNATDWATYPDQAGQRVNAAAQRPLSPTGSCQEYLRVRSDGLVAIERILGCFPPTASFTPIVPFRQGGEPCTVLGSDKTLDNDTLPCSDPTDFMQSGDSAKKSYIGTCWIQTTHIGPSYTRQGVHGETEIGAQPGFGIRYERLFGYPIGYRGGETQAPQVAARWRNQIQAEISGRGNFYEANTPARYYEGDNWRTRSGVLKATAGSDADRRSAAAYVRDNAICLLAAIDPLPTSCPPGTAGCPGWESDEETRQDYTADGINVVVSVPDVAQVGYTSGGTRQARVTAVPGSMLCDGRPCDPAKVRLDTLTFSLQVSQPGGYRECRSGQLSGCDFRVLEQPRTNSPRQGAQAWSAEFYAPTAGSSRFQVALTNVSATYRAFIVESYTLCVPRRNPVTNQITTECRTLENRYWSEPRPLTVAISGVPDSFQVIGATIRPR
jgi:hypothetical protein